MNPTLTHALAALNRARDHRVAGDAFAACAALEGACRELVRVAQEQEATVTALSNAVQAWLATRDARLTKVEGLLASLEIDPRDGDAG